jgi:hypothetical protein
MSKRTNRRRKGARNATLREIRQEAREPAQAVAEMTGVWLASRPMPWTDADLYAVAAFAFERAQAWRTIFAGILKPPEADAFVDAFFLHHGSVMFDVAARELVQWQR